MVTRPNVSPDAIVDFDHHSDEFNLNELAINADLDRNAPSRGTRDTPVSGSAPVTTR